MPVIQIEHLTKDYGHHRGVFNISFNVEKGEVYGFLGPNGAGKTTAIRHIMGFSRPQEGRTAVNGLDSWKKAGEIQKSLGYLPGEIALPDAMTGPQFIHMMAELRGMKDLKHTDFLMQKFELDPAGRLKRMSLGVKRKLAIVTAFMHDPDVLVLDEPTSGLDPIMQRIFIEFIKEEKERGKTILLSSHIFNEVDATCDKISIIKEGRLISTFVTDELHNSRTKTYKFEFERKDGFQGFSNQIRNCREFEVMSLNEGKNQGIVRVNDDHINEFISLISEYDLKFFSEIKLTLEEHFMKFYDQNSGSERGGDKNAAD